MAVSLEALELRRIAITLRRPFRTAFGVQHERDVLLVKAITTDGNGWGECVAPAAPEYTSEYTAGAEHVIEHHLAPVLLAMSNVDAEDVASALRPVRGHLMAKAAVETAILDADLRARHVSLAAYLGARADAIRPGVSLGIPGSLAELMDEVAARLDEGYQRIKLKIEPGWDAEPVCAVRDRFGSALQLQVDANGGYEPTQTAQLEALDQLDLLLLEQPFQADELEAHARLAGQMSTPICLDESIGSARDAAAALDRGACSVINVKPGRVGGYLEARRIHDLCVERGADLFCGGVLETGIGRAGNLALAGLPGCTLPGDVSASDRYYTRDLTAPFRLCDGLIDIPQGPGLGVEPDAEALADMTRSVKVMTNR